MGILSTTSCRFLRNFNPLLQALMISKQFLFLVRARFFLLFSPTCQLLFLHNLAFLLTCRAPARAPGHRKQRSICFCNQNPIFAHPSTIPIKNGSQVLFFSKYRETGFTCGKKTGFTNALEYTNEIAVKMDMEPVFPTRSTNIKKEKTI